jgi:hypothetical protein
MPLVIAEPVNGLIKIIVTIKSDICFFITISMLSITINSLFYGSNKIKKKVQINLKFKFVVITDQ